MPIFLFNGLSSASFPLPLALRGRFSLSLGGFIDDVLLREEVDLTPLIPFIICTLFLLNNIVSIIFERTLNEILTKTEFLFQNKCNF